MLRHPTVGDVARHFGVPAWQVTHAISRGYLNDPPRIGCYRVFTYDDLPKVWEALIRARLLRRRGGGRCALTLAQGRTRHPATPLPRHPGRPRHRSLRCL